MIENSIATRCYSVLLVQDTHADVAFAKHALSSLPPDSFQVEYAENLAQALVLLRRDQVDLALVDLTLSDSKGISTFNAIRAADPAVAIVILTAVEDEATAIAALQHGAQDYLLEREVKPPMLRRTLRYAIERQRSAAISLLNVQLEASQKTLTDTIARLQLANEDLAQFTCFFSHDLQEPLRKLTYFTKLLKEDAGPNLSDQSHRDIDFISDAARRMQGQVNSLLALSRAGQACLEWDRVDLEECVADALNCLCARSDATKAKIVRAFLPSVVGDATMLTHLYLNLIGNALKFTRGRQPVIELTAEVVGKFWILGVRDNGIGIEPKNAQLIFAPFQRIDTAEKYEGSGVGLAVCKKVVERHGGLIWMESTPNGGAHFKFSLPNQDETGMESHVLESLAEPALC